MHVDEKTRAYPSLARRVRAAIGRFESTHPRRAILLVLFLFTIVGVARHMHQFGEDLASSYVGCRLLAAGQEDHLYSHSEYVFSKVDDPVWFQVGHSTGFYPLRMLHPYVQTPLWAWSLEPICTHVRYRTFCNAYIVLFMLCVSGLLWVVARYWAPSLFHPGSMALVYLVLYRSEPFKYAIFLAQTHIVYVLMAVLALVLSQRHRPVSAGLLLALAAAVKITPGVLVLYWLVTRQYKAAITFVIASVTLVATTILVLSSGLMHTYLTSLAFDSNVLLRAFNNQSLAAWWVTLGRPRGGMLQWGIYPLPHALKLGAELFTVGAVLLGGWLDRRVHDRGFREAETPPPFGANMALLGATMCAPIAWTHYYIMLVIPTMLFLDRRRRGGGKVWVVLIVAIVALNYYPLAMGAVHVTYYSFTIIRSQFYSGVLAIAGLVYLAYEQAHVMPALPMPAVVSPLLTARYADEVHQVATQRSRFGFLRLATWHLFTRRRTSLKA